MFLSFEEYVKRFHRMTVAELLDEEDEDMYDNIWAAYDEYLEREADEGVYDLATHTRHKDN